MDDIEIEKKRAIIADAYSSESWKEKVMKMSPAQVTAVHIRLRNQGKIG